MRPAFITAVFLAALPLSAQPVSVPSPENSPQPPLPIPLLAPTGRAWLGVQLDRVDPTMSAHIPGLPQGVGMLVKAVDENGPANDAKLRTYDVIWKMDDQLLVNSAQLATLLRLKKPGDEVMLSVFRSGQPIEVKMNLGDIPIGKDGFSHELAEAAILPTEGGPVRMVNLAEKTVVYSNEEGKAVLRKDGDSYLVVIRKANEELIYEGEVSTKDQVEVLPENWRRRVCALKRGLDYAIEGSIVPVRPPRPRVVPPPSTNP